MSPARQTYGRRLHRLVRRFTGANDQVLARLARLVRDQPNNTTTYELRGMVEEAHRQVWD